MVGGCGVCCVWCAVLLLFRVVVVVVLVVFVSAFNEMSMSTTGAQLLEELEEREKSPTLHRHQTLLKAPCLSAYWKVHKLWR